MVYIKFTSLIFSILHYSITFDIFILYPYTLYACKILKQSKNNNYLVCKVNAFQLMRFLKLYTEYEFIDQLCFVCFESFDWKVTCALYTL